MFFAVDIYLASGIFSKEHAIIDFHVQRGDLAILAYLSLSHGDYFSFLRLFLGGIRDDDATLALLFLLDTFHNNAILQRPNFHLLPPFVCLVKCYLDSSQAVRFRVSGKLDRQSGINLSMKPAVSR